MKSGLIISNENNNVQITSDYLNLQIIGKSAVSDGQPRGAGILAVQPIKGETPVFVDKNIGEGIFHNVAFNNQSQKNIGLQVFTPTGRVAYDSSLKNLRVLDRVTIKAPSASTSQPELSWSKRYTGKDVAVIFMKTTAAAFIRDDYGVLVGDLRVSAVELDVDDVLTVLLAPTGNTVSPGVPFYGWLNFSGDCEFLVIDVTGY